MSSDRRARQSRARRPARATHKRQELRRILVLCEGRVTEPQYILGLEAYFRNATIQLDISPEVGVPLTLVKRAVALRDASEREGRRRDDRYLRYDEVWCVCDVDEHPNLQEALHYARTHGVEIALSNPCFELWLLLHARESPGAQHRHEIQRRVREVWPGYDKHLSFEALSPQLDVAHQRAARQCQRADEDGEPTRNPTTSFYRFVDTLRRTTP